MRLVILFIILVSSPFVVEGQLSQAVSKIRAFPMSTVLVNNQVSLEEKEMLEFYNYCRAVSQVTDSIYLKYKSARTSWVAFDSILITGQYLQKRVGGVPGKAFDLYRRSLEDPASIGFRNVVATDVLEGLVAKGSDGELTKRYLDYHLSLCDDEVEYCWNSYFKLRHSLNQVYFEGADPQGLAGEFEALIEQSVDLKADKLVSRVYSTYGALLSYSPDTKLESIGAFQKSIDYTSNCDPIVQSEMAFVNMANIAAAYLSDEQYAEANAVLQKVDSTSTKLEDPQNRSYYYDWLSSSFEGLGVLDSALLYKKLASEQLEKASKLKYATGIRTVEEKYRNKELSDELTKTALTLKSRSYLIGLILLLLLSSLVAIFLTRRISKQKRLALEDQMKLKEVEAQNTRLKALEAERTRIASEMHDDLGGGLTTIKFLSQKVLRKLEDEQQKASVQKIVSNSQTLVSNMSEIIWAMNAGFDTLDNLVAYSRRYAYEYLDDYPITLRFSVSGELDGVPLSGEQRRNLFLILKEALHNTVKYAEASEVTVEFAVQDNSLQFSISDNGVGLPADDNILGNGLTNMRSRASSLRGDVSLYSEGGLLIQVTVPLQDDGDP